MILVVAVGGWGVWRKGDGATGRWRERGQEREREREGERESVFEREGWPRPRTTPTALMNQTNQLTDQFGDGQVVPEADILPRRAADRPLHW